MVVAAECQRSCEDVTALCRLSVFREVVAEENFERIAGVYVALKIHVIGEHVDHFDDHGGSDAGVNRSLVQAGINGCLGVLIFLFEFALYGFREIVVRRRQMHVDQVIDGRRKG